MIQTKFTMFPSTETTPSFCQLYFMGHYVKYQAQQVTEQQAEVWRNVSMRLAQGHTTRKWQSQDLSPTVSDSKLSWPRAVNIEVYFLPIFFPMQQDKNTHM